MRITKIYLNELTYRVIGCAIEVHKYLGPDCWRVFTKNVLSGSWNYKVFNFKKNMGAYFL